MRFELQNYYKPSITADMIIMSVADGKSTWEINGSDFFMTEEWPVPRTPAQQTRRSGTLIAEFTFTVPDGEIVSQGEISIPLKSDWAWEITFYPLPNNPCFPAFGCSGYKVFPLATAYMDTVADSLYVTWGGNSIKNPVIY